MTEPSGNPTITLCITELDRGGAEKALVRIACGLQDSGWSVRVISLRDAGVMAEPLRRSGIEVVALHCGGMADLRCYGRLREQLRTHRSDVLLSFLHQANVYGRLAGRAAGVPVIVSGIRVADRRRWVLMTDRWTRRRVDQYIAVSPSVARFHAAACGIPDKQMSAIPNGVDSVSTDTGTASRWFEIEGPSARPEPLNLLFVGRLTAQKNPLLLLDVFERLAQELRTSATLTYVGDGPLKSQLQQQITSRGLQKSVRLVGAVDDVRPFWQTASVLLLPSRWEGMPNVVLEAMAAAVPVVASSVDGVSDVLTDGETGWLVKEADPERWAQVLQTLVEQPGEVRRRVKAAKTLVERDFSWSSVVQQYDGLLRSLRDQQPVPGSVNW